jgi:hypothetical protein
MAIIHPYMGKRKKQKPNAEQRALAEAWDRLQARHSNPLELGSKAKGKLPGTKNVKGVPKAIPVFKRKNEDIPSLPMNGTATLPISDPAAAEKHAMKARAGVNYNKGGLQFLSDLDMAEQKTGVHKRR